MHEIRVRVRYADTDQMGLVHHARYFEWFEMGRTELMRALGLSYKAFEEAGYRLPVAEANAVYLRPAFYDDFLTIRTILAERPQPKLRLDYEVFRDKDLLATGYTTHVFVNPKGRPVKPPRLFLDLLD